MQKNGHNSTSANNQVSRNDVRIFTNIQGKNASVISSQLGTTKPLSSSYILPTTLSAAVNEKASIPEQTTLAHEILNQGSKSNTVRHVPNAASNNGNNIILQSKSFLTPKQGITVLNSGNDLDHTILKTPIHSSTSLMLQTSNANTTLIQGIKTVQNNGSFIPLTKFLISRPQQASILTPTKQTAAKITTNAAHPLGTTGAVSKIANILNTSTPISATSADKKTDNETKSTHDSAFDWEEYFKLTSQTMAPLKCFKHVHLSQQTGFLPGMKLEVANNTVPNTYWVASVIETRGKLLKLRYDGFNNDLSEDFLVNIKTDNLHPIGWCAQNSKILQPPEHIKNQHHNWADFLVKNLIGARTVPTQLLTPPSKGKAVMEMIESGMLLEIQDSQHPEHVWIAHVEKNVGGRLLLRYEGMTDQDVQHDFWLYYLNIRLHHLGWGKDHGLTMKPPDHIRKKYSTGEQWVYVLSLSLKGITEQQLVPAYVFQEQVKHKEHGIKLFGKLAVLDPVYPTKVRPATVTSITSKYFFLAELDQTEGSSLSPAFLCHSSSSGIFSISWCKKYKIPITLPNGNTVCNFDWGAYIEKCNIPELPANCFTTTENHNFTKGMMLEAGNPFNLNEIRLARIIDVHGSIIRLQLNNALECFVPASSHDIFPVGWCKANNYPLSCIKMWSPIASKSNETKQLKQVVVKAKTINIPLPNIKQDANPVISNKSTNNIISFVNPNQNSELWCPAICFNCTCNIGNQLHFVNLSKVPQRVGPGNIILVLKEVMSLLVGSAHNPIKLLKDFALATAEINQQECDLKAKYLGKKYQATVFIADKTSAVPKFLNTITSLLKACPNLLSMRDPIKSCPLNCTAPLALKPKLNQNAMLKQKRQMSKVIKRRFKRQNEYESPNKKQLVLKNRKSYFYNAKQDISTNPFDWSVKEVVEYIKLTECGPLASIFFQQEIDGQALLMLTLPVVQECMELKLGPALKLCKIVEDIKSEFYKNYAT